MIKEIKTEIVINSSIENVWTVLTNFEAYAEWNPFMLSLTGNVATGQQIKVRIQTVQLKAFNFGLRCSFLIHTKKSDSVANSS